MPISSLKVNHIAHFREVRRRKGKGAIRANREVAVLSAAFEMGMREMVCDFNPCRGSKRNTERPRRKVVTDEMFLGVFERCNEPFQDLISAALLTGARQTDLISWTRAQMTPKGIDYVESKTGKPHLQLWSKALQFFVDRAMRRQPDAELIFTNTYGLAWTTAGIASQLARLKSPWCFKDLRAKAQTDSEHSVLGHGAVMEAVYRKKLTTRPVR